MTLETSYLATRLDKQALGLRFKEARKQAGLSQREMARHLGYKSATAIANKEKGLAYPSVVDVYYLSFRSGLSIDWIVSGVTPDMSVDDILAGPEVLSAEEVELIHQYRALDDKLKARLVFVLMRLKNESEK